MNILNVNFKELYARHLCRHSQFGINVIHLATLIGTYLAILSILHWLTGSWWVLPALAVPYLAIQAFNLPARLFAVLLASVAVLFSLHWLVNLNGLLPVLETASVPGLPVWVCLVLIFVFYKIQVWSHRPYSLARDMTEFNQKYPKGAALFVLLSLYEMPLLLNYLCFDRKSWSSGAGSEMHPTSQVIAVTGTSVAERPPASV